jgi:hypothetical protein
MLAGHYSQDAVAVKSGVCQMFIRYQPNLSDRRQHGFGTAKRSAADLTGFDRL